MHIWDKNTKTKTLKQPWNVLVLSRSHFICAGGHYCRPRSAQRLSPHREPAYNPLHDRGQGGIAGTELVAHSSESQSTLAQHPCPSLRLLPLINQSYSKLVKHAVRSLLESSRSAHFRQETAMHEVKWRQWRAIVITPCWRYILKANNEQ